ncbi:MAG: hypothetical protein CVU63_04470 [Deltaproteobacteria bacterium HGW-Deltaproteobacteria-20]|nr:MAG: hypothetical protein CVU63_04470 [Deltaproteobacteria bacterium HGW-Deltaproteobacteria-20]
MTASRGVSTVRGVGPSGFGGATGRTATRGLVASTGGTGMFAPADDALAKAPCLADAVGLACEGGSTDVVCEGAVSDAGPGGGDVRHAQASIVCANSANHTVTEGRRRRTRGGGRMRDLT